MLKAGVMPGHHSLASEGDTTEAAQAGDDGTAGAADGSGTGGAEMDPDPPQQCESKLRALLAELHAMQAADATSKALVFSQYR